MSSCSFTPTKTWPGVMSLLEVMVTLRKSAWWSLLQTVCGTADWQLVRPVTMPRLGISEGRVLAEESLTGMVVNVIRLFGSRW